MNGFMGQSGRDTYYQAFKFFKKRSQLQRKKSSENVKKAKEKIGDLSIIQLDGESDASVPVYDSCGEVYRKIRTYLVTPGVTQARILGEAVKKYQDGRRIQFEVLNDFLKWKGAYARSISLCSTALACSLRGCETRTGN